MDFSKALEFWRENQLRILALASLSIQWFLFIFARFRQRPIPGLLRFFIWLAYLGSDAVPIYTLATLFNSRRCDHTSSHLVMEIMSAPILLVHLGGQDSITAYNIEDNELWRRHVLTVASQVAVASYVFFKPWPKLNVTTAHLVVDQTTTDWVKVEVHPYGRIFAPAYVVFVRGILLCVLKPWDLKRVSVNSLVDSSVPEENGESEIISLQEYVAAATQYLGVETGHGRGGLLQPSGNDICIVDYIWKPYNLCVDLAPSYSGRLSCLKHLVRNPDEAHRLVKYNLSSTFLQLYTKESLNLHQIRELLNSSIVSAQCLRLLVLMGLSLAILIFPYRCTDPTDVTITYVLLCSALVMKCPTGINHNGHRTWPDHVTQYNLMGYVARSKKHSWLMKVAAWLGCRNLVDQLWTMKPCKGSSSQEITGIVHGHVAGGWKGGHIAGPESFRAFNDYRGQWTLGRELPRVGRSIPSIALTSVSRPFDESVLVWHLATDFCFHLLEEDTSPSSDAARRCREMSNYMAYLLFVKPEMLMPGARRNLFKEACAGLVDVLEEDPPHEPRGFAHKVIQVLQRDGDGVQGSAGSGVVRQAWIVAKDLMDSLRGDKEKMWRVIQGVWVEMLCFSASRCKGYLHAKSLGTGGEYLSYVWLLLLYMGMETLAEKMQRTELHEGHTAVGSSINGQNV